MTATSRASRARLLDAFRLAMLLLAIGLGVAAVARDREGFVDALALVGWTRTAVALVLVAVGLVLSAEAWRATVASVAIRLPAGAAARIFFLSQLGKYVPGGIWTIAAQVDLARRYAIRRTAMAVGSLLHILYHLVTGVLVAGIGALLVAPEVPAARPLGALAVAGSLAVLAPPLLDRAIGVGLRLLRREPVGRTLGWRDVAPPTAWLGGTWTAFGLATAVVVTPLADDTSTVAVGVLGTVAFAVGWVLGVLVIPAPAGVGVRELAFVGLLAPAIGVTGATSVAILLRVLHTVADLALAALSRLGSRPPEPDASA